MDKNLMRMSSEGRPILKQNLDCWLQNGNFTLSVKWILMPNKLTLTQSIQILPGI